LKDNEEEETVTDEPVRRRFSDADEDDTASKDDFTERKYKQLEDDTYLEDINDGMNEWAQDLLQYFEMTEYDDNGNITDAMRARNDMVDDIEEHIDWTIERKMRESGEIFPSFDRLRFKDGLGEAMDRNVNTTPFISQTLEEELANLFSNNK